MSLHIRRERRFDRITVVTISTAIGTFDFKISSYLPPRARRTLAVELLRQMKPFLHWIRTISLNHFDVEDFNLSRTERRGIPLSMGKGLATRAGRLGFEIRLNRLQLGLSQKDFANRARLSRSYLSRIEHGLTHPKRNTIEIIRDVIVKERETLRLPPF
jgi:DNA-binding transcriptional regulator YiaG